MDLNSSTNSSVDNLQCEPNPVAHPITTAYLATLHTVTLVAFIVVGKMVYDKIEIAHPVFALAFQELIVMIVSKIVELVCLMGQVVMQSDLAFLLYTFVPVAALQFHQVTWLSITGLRHTLFTICILSKTLPIYIDFYLFRFYLLFVLKPDSDVDMDRLRRLSIALVWGTEVIFIPLCQLPWYLIVKDYGWPERSILDILFSDDIVALKTITATVLISNLPDYLSIVIYATMIWNQLDIGKTIEPANDVENVEEEDQFGGIWMGEGLSERLPEMLPSTEEPLGWREGEMKSPPPPPPSSPQPNFQQPLPPPSFPMENDTDDTDSQCYHRLRCVMPVLRWHVALSLFDLVATGVNVLFCQGELGKMITYLVQVCCCYWISLVMITKNYKQLGSIKQYVLSKLC